MQNSQTKEDKAVESLLQAAVSSGSLSLETLNRIKKLEELQNNLADFLIDRFQRNIECFRKHLPDIANKFEHYKPSRSIEFFCLENGVPNLMYVDTQEVLYKAEDPSFLCKKQVQETIETTYLSSTRYRLEYDPIGQIHHRYINEMTAIIDQNKTDEKIYASEVGSLANCVVLGVGLGYHIGYLYEKLEIANCVIIEPDEDLFFASLHTFDWANLLNYLLEGHYGIYFELGVTPERLFADLNGYYSKRGEFLSAFWWMRMNLTQAS